MSAEANDGPMTRPDRFPTFFLWIPHPLRPYYAESKVTPEFLAAIEGNPSAASFIIDDLLKSLRKFEEAHGIPPVGKDPKPLAGEIGGG